MTTITATPATITELYAERAAGETTAAMLTDGRDILDISRNDDGSFHLWTSLGEVSNVAGGRMVIAPPARTTATPVITYRLPYDATTRDHNCLVTIEGEPEQSIGYAPTFHEAEKKCRQYIDDLLASDLFRPASELDGGSDAAVIGDPTRDVDERYCERCTRVTVHRLVAKYGTFFCGSCSVCACGTLAIYGGVTPCCQACHDQALAEMDDQPADDPSHNLTLPDVAECPDISAPQPVEELSTCERYSTPPSLALWGPGTPECPTCGQRHDPILKCPNPIAVAAPPPKPGSDETWFILPDAQAGDCAEHIYISIGGIVYDCHATQVAALLKASTQARPVCPGCGSPLPGATFGLCSACLRAEEAACYDQEWSG